MEELLFLHSNVSTVIAMDDPELVGEFLSALRVLGCADSDEAMQRGYAYLLAKEQMGKAAGSWVKSSEGFYKRYHAAYCAIIGLAEMTLDSGAVMEPQWRPFLE